MATKPNPAAARAKKQKILLIGASAVLVLLALLQGPKLWKQINPPAPEAAAPASAGATGAAVTPATSTTTVPASTVTVATAQTPSGAATLTAVSVSPRPSVEEGQLAAFTLFEVKDPFEQQVSADTGAGTATVAAATNPSPAAIASGSNAPVATGGTPAKAKEPAPTYATIQVDGKPSQVQVKDAFPQPDKIFVLVSLKKSKAKIGVKGGSFADGDLVQLTLGKPVTLMNTTTGSRYVVKLVYTGNEPENIEGFSQPQPAASEAPAASGAPTATSGAPTATSGTDTAASGNG